MVVRQGRRRLSGHIFGMAIQPFPAMYAGNAADSPEIALPIGTAFHGDLSMDVHAVPIPDHDSNLNLVGGSRSSFSLALSMATVIRGIHLARGADPHGQLDEHAWIQSIPPCRPKLIHETRRWVLGTSFDGGVA
jgi:hypothetical protein